MIAADLRTDDFEFIRALVYRRSRIRLTPDKKDLVAARLARRVRATGIASVSEYCRRLHDPQCAQELTHLIDAIATNHTSFFRENAHFQFTRTQAVPEFLARARPAHWHRLNAWSAACSTGEEPYSLAIVLAESLGGRLPWRIEASDISERALATAQAAIYSSESLKMVPGATARAHFQRGVGSHEGSFRVKAALRAGVHFHHLNLLGDEPPFREPFHLIFCRNVMIYFDPPTREELIERLWRRLIPGGYLFVGLSESLAGIHHGLETVEPAIYRRPMRPAA